ncbi:MAG: hypothetical protein ACOYT7_01675 [Patescibacteria group bacterium]
MAEVKPEEIEVSHEEFVAWTLENARNMARYSIGETPPPDFALEKASDLEIARYLAQVEVDDSKLSKQIKEALDKNLTDPDTIFQAGSLVIAKSEAAREVASPPHKTRLENLSQKIASQIPKLLDSSTSRRAFLKAAPALLSVLATACGIADTLRNLPWLVEYTYPTPEGTEVVQPTETSTPTPEPWLIEELPWHWIGEWQRVETTNEETGETIGYNVRFVVSEGLPFDRIDFATAESTYLIFEDAFYSAGVNEGRLRADLETLLAENPDGWAEEDMARAISLALEGAQRQFANINPADRQRW